MQTVYKEKCQSFTNLCDEFISASAKAVESVQDNLDKKASDIAQYHTYKPEIMAQMRTNISTIGKFMGTMLRLFSYSAIAKITPKSVGKRLMDHFEYDPRNNLGLIFAEHAARVQIKTGIHPMRIAEKMPEALKTPENLDLAEWAKMKYTAEIIRYDLQRQSHKPTPHKI